MHDTDQIKRQNNIVTVIGQYTKLTKSGKDHVGLCPFHSEKTPSFRVDESEGFYKCFGCGVGGDVIKFVMKINNIDFKTAVKKLGGEDIGTNYTSPVIQPIIQPPKKKEKWKNIIPIPDDAKPPENFFKFKIQNYYPYKNISGELIGYTCRYLDEKKKKNVVPLTYSINGDTKKWQFKKFNSGSPIYGIEDLSINKDAKILMVEGEKCRDAASKLFKDSKEIITLSWLGGTDRAPKVDWSPLKDCTVIYWPDADTKRYEYGPQNGEMMSYFDQPGNKAMIQINKLIGGKSKIIKHPDDKINGWDIADAIESGWDLKKVKKYILDNMINFEDLYKKEEHSKVSSEPFQCLGYNSQVGTPFYYYLPNGTNKVVELNPSAHSKMNMLGMAPTTYWEREYPGNSPNYTLAADVCMRKCEARGIYDSFRVRGRGAWFDNGRVVLHMGDRLVVDNKTIGVSDIDSFYIYESGLPIDNSDYSTPIKKEESKKLLDICKMFSWTNDFDAVLLSGWLALAHIGGAIDWRPHVWLTGESGTGKSWIYDNVITPILGRFSLNLSSSSTEAGIRCSLGNDAMPVYKDECEAETKEALALHMRILELVRQASSNKGSKIVKGTAMGGSVSYCIRSPFLFVSINAKLIQQSDESRFSVLKLIKREDYAEGSKFAELKKLVIDTITPEWCAGLRARSASIIPSIRSNVEIFAAEASKILMNNRYGEQIGTLLAGSYSLISDSIVDKGTCKKMLEKINLTNIVAVESVSDQERLVYTICEQLVPHEKEVLSIGTLIIGASKSIDETQDDVPFQKNKRYSYLDTLRKYGISVVINSEADTEVVFAKKHSKLESLLYNTPWDKGYNLVLARFNGAVTKKASYNSVKYWVVSIPFKKIFTEKIGVKYEEDF